MAIYAIANQKGGVGKTTLALNFAAALAEIDTTAAVLLVDLDPQGHCTEGCALREVYLEPGYNLYEALTQNPGKFQKSQLEHLIKAIPHERFFILPSNYTMMLAEQALHSVKGREYRLELLLEATGQAFGEIVIDCPPNLGILTDNALYAARVPKGGLIIPVQAEQTSMRALELLLDQIVSCEQGLRIKIEKLAIVPNLVQSSKLSRDILASLRQNIPVTTLFEFSKRVVLQEAYACGQSIFTYTPSAKNKLREVQELKAIYCELAHLVKERSRNHGK